MRCRCMGSIRRTGNEGDSVFASEFGWLEDVAADSGGHRYRETGQNDILACAMMGNGSLLTSRYLRWSSLLTLGCSEERLLLGQLGSDSFG